MTWESLAFTHVEDVQGSLTVEMMGQSMEMPYSARLHRSADGRVGAVVADGPQGETWMFVSLVDGGGVYTQPAPRPGDMDIDGDRLVTTPSTDRDGVLAAHLNAVGDDALADGDALLEALRAGPQTAVRLAAEIMKRMAAGLAATKH